MADSKTSPNYVGICLGVSAFIIALSASYYYLRILPSRSTSQTPTTSLPAVSSQAPKFPTETPTEQPALNEQASNLDLQAKCSEQAQKTLAYVHGSIVNASPSYHERNHYNEQMQKCFVVIFDATGGTGNQVTNIVALYDAYENNELADAYYYSASIPDPRNTFVVGNLKVSYQEYSDYIKLRMGSGFDTLLPQ